MIGEGVGEGGKGDCELASDVAFPFPSIHVIYSKRSPCSSRGPPPVSAVLAPEHAEVSAAISP